MTGRGGAGNIQAANRRISKDLEASQEAAEEGTDNSPIAQALRNDQAPRTLATSGRGGAGNTYNPVELFQTGQFNVPPSGGRNGGTDEGEGVRMVGRGGAGNYIPGVIEGRETEASSRQEGNQGPGKLSPVEQEVERDLRKPQAAHLAPKEKEKDVPAQGV